MLPIPLEVTIDLLWLLWILAPLWQHRCSVCSSGLSYISERAFLHNILPILLFGSIASSTWVTELIFHYSSCPLARRKWKWSLSHVPLFVTPWTVAYQAPPSMGFPRQEYWSGLPFPSPGDLPDPGMEPGSPTLWADTLPSEPPGKPTARSGEMQSQMRYSDTGGLWCVCHGDP